MNNNLYYERLTQTKWACIPFIGSVSNKEKNFDMLWGSWHHIISQLLPFHCSKNEANQCWNLWHVWLQQLLTMLLHIVTKELYERIWQLLKYCLPKPRPQNIFSYSSQLIHEIGDSKEFGNDCIRTHFKLNGWKIGICLSDEEYNGKEKQTSHEKITQKRRILPSSHLTFPTQERQGTMLPPARIEFYRNRCL